MHQSAAHRTALQRSWLFFTVCVWQKKHKVCYCNWLPACPLCVCSENCGEQLTSCWLLTPRIFFPPHFLASPLLSSPFCPCCILCPFLLILFSFFSASFLPGSSLFSYLRVRYHLPDTDEYSAAYKNKPLFCTTVLQQKCR